MKKLTLALFVVMAVVFYSCQGQQSFGGYTISGTIEGASGIAVLNRPEGRELKAIDSVKIENGKFTLEGKAEQEEMVVLKLGEGRNFVQFFLENANIEIEGKVADLQNAVIKGGVNNTVFEEFKKMNKDFREAGNEMRQRYMAAKEDSAQQKAISDEFESSRKVFMGKVHDVVKKNNNAAVSLLLTGQFLANDLDFEDLKAIVENADASLHENKLYTDLKADVEAKANVQIGKVAPDFTMNTPEGTPLALSSLYGKGYLLVDFWAAWCRPCRAENPNVVAAYNKFKDKGFDVLGVSFDRTKEDWTKAIEQDGLVWNQVSDLKYWECAAGKLYAIKSIPQNVLLDKEGKIVAKNLRGEDLHKKLAELLGE